MFLHDSYVCGSVLLWQHYDTLCTSGFMDVGETLELPASQPDNAVRRVGLARQWLKLQAINR